MKHVYTTIIFLTIFCNAFLKAQKGYDIKINFKNCTDSTVYLARYFFDQLPVIDSCKKIKNGKIQFKGTSELQKGIYFLANQSKTAFYFQFIVDNNQNFTITSDALNYSTSTKSADDKQNDQFFSYVRFMSEKAIEMNAVLAEAKKKNKLDSAKLVNDKQKIISEESYKFDLDFKARNKGTFLYDLMNMKTEKYATDVPTAKNGRPDSLYQYFYYKSHYFDGVNFKDERIIYTPFFADRIKKYFDQIVPQHPDSVIKALDYVLEQCTPGTTIFNTLVGHFTYKYETNKAMSFDNDGNCNTFEKVFIHLSDKYIVSGKTKGYYSDETVEKIRERITVLKNLLPGAKVADLFTIDTIFGKQVLKMGFDTAKTSAGCTMLYNKNIDKISPLFKNLYSINAKYTVLVFWAADCGHCQTEIPKLHKDLEDIKGKIDFKVLAVQTKEELFETWKKFIIEKQLNDFIHVFDPVHVNNLKVKFDIIGTPVIYLLDADKKIIGKKLVSEQTVDIIKMLEKIDQNKKSNKN